ncbi:MAG: tRNA 2-thiouridine(34) synthase MnmA [Parcubacteria group bacterium]|jgi:tRNA-specific 2-thiouridylase
MANKKVLIALSGGVDSAVSAALLKKQGFQIVGVFFRFFDGSSAKKSLRKAKKVAESLDIDLEVVDVRKEFKKKIVDYFIDSYRKGVTPNPCVVCNKEMKFRSLFDLMKEYKADFVATGHYARNDKLKLLEAKDKTKDQSYFLYRLAQRELAKIVFPLGGFEKTETRRIAKKMKLPVFGNKESQDVCFLADSGINQFLQKNIKLQPGNIIDEKGSVLAKHKGLPFYTIGQRKGIEIGAAGPYFVIGKNSRKNELVVSNDPKKLLVRKFFVSKVNWINKKTKLPLSAQIQIRYHAEKISAIIKSGKPGKLIVETKKPLRAVMKGQSAVFYKNKEVLGGGIIA